MTESALPNFGALWDFNHPGETERKFIGLLDSIGCTAPATYRAELMTQIARAQGLQRKFDDGHRTLDEVMASGVMETSPKLFTRYLLERGRLFNSAQKTEQAAPLFREAVDVASAAGEESFAIDAAHMLGICLPAEKSVEWNEKAISMAERATNPRARAWLGSLLNNLGWTYHDQGKYPQALNLFEKALAYRQSRNELPEVRIAKWTIARTLRSLGRIDEALAMQETLRAEHEATGESDGFVFEEIAECLTLLGRGDEAKAYFGKAYELLSADVNLAATEPKRLERLKKLAD